MIHKTLKAPSKAGDARAVRTRLALRRAMLELLEVKPLDQITIRDIAATAGVGYTTFFRHHATKEACLDDVAAEQIQRLIGLTLPVLDAGGTGSASLALCSYVDQHRALWTTLLTGGAAGTMREEFLRLSRLVAAERGRPDRRLPTEVAVIIISSSTIELLAWWLRQKDPLPVERIAEIHERYVILPTIRSAAFGDREQQSFYPW
jgi:AcrR family transcriptional regulator